MDAETGKVLRRLQLPGSLLASESVDGDLVVVLAVDGGLTVERHDVVRGRELWSVRLRDMFVADPRLVLRATSDVVALQGVTAVVLDATDGRELDRWRPVGRPSQGMSVRVVARAGEGFGVWTSPFLGQWYCPDGDELAELHGYPAEPAVSDGSTPGVILLGSDDGRRLVAVDVSTGEQRWERPMPERVLLRLAGRLVAAGDGSLEAVDMATGRSLWRTTIADGDEPGIGPALTDGLRVLVRGWDESGRPRLTAYDLEDGARAWQAGVPGGGQRVSVLGGRLVSSDGRLDGGHAGVIRFLG